MRAAARAAIDAADSAGLQVAARFEFDREIVTPDFDEWLAVVIGLDKHGDEIVGPLAGRNLAS